MTARSLASLSRKAASVRYRSIKWAANGAYNAAHRSSRSAGLRGRPKWIVSTPETRHGVSSADTRTLKRALYPLRAHEHLLRKRFPWQP
jgi:hypothetical protein